MTRKSIISILSGPSFLSAASSFALIAGPMPLSACETRAVEGSSSETTFASPIRDRQFLTMCRGLSENQIRAEVGPMMLHAGCIGFFEGVVSTFRSTNAEVKCEIAITREEAGELYQNIAVAAEKMEVDPAQEIARRLRRKHDLCPRR